MERDSRGGAVGEAERRECELETDFRNRIKPIDLTFKTVGRPPWLEQDPKWRTIAGHLTESEFHVPVRGCAGLMD
jgi:hypothetical protein